MTVAAMHAATKEYDVSQLLDAFRLTALPLAAETEPHLRGAVNLARPAGGCVRSVRDRRWRPG